jgi:hypothetical protein
MTLIELTVVVVILVALVLVLGKGASVVTSKSILTDCAARAKSIGTVVRLYAAEWQGNTNPNTGAFPALFGLPLRGDPKYVPEQAFAVSDFACPLDQNPFVLETGYRSSYQLASAFAGGKLHALEDSRSTVMLSEMGKRHKDRGVPASVYLFSDLHYETGGPDPNEPGGERLMPGLRSRWYNKSNDLTVPASESRKDLVWNEPVRCDGGGGLFFLPGYYYDSSSGWQCVSDWDRNAANEPMRILGVWDGHLRFPQTGSWTLDFECSALDRCYLEVDDQIIQGAGNQTLVHSFQEGRTSVEFRFLETGDGISSSYLRLFWRKTDPPAVSRQLIPARCFSHVPFEPTNVQN